MFYKSTKFWISLAGIAATSLIAVFGHGTIKDTDLIDFILWITLGNVGAHTISDVTSTVKNGNGVKRRNG